MIQHICHLKNIHEAKLKDYNINASIAKRSLFRLRFFKVASRWEKESSTCPLLPILLQPIKNLLEVLKDSRSIKNTWQSVSFDKTMIFPREYPFYGKWIYFDISVLIFFFFSIMYFRSWFPRNSFQKQPPEVLKKTVLKTSQYSVTVSLQQRCFLANIAKLKYIYFEIHFANGCFYQSWDA